MAGVLAAQRVHGSSEGLSVRMFDTGDREEETLAMFNLAKSQGAVAVIGPLTRGAMNFLADTGELTIPVLALNSFDEATLRRPGLFSFNLSIDSEVEQIVSLMRAQGVSAPAVLVMGGALSQRMARNFAKAWGSGGALPRQIEVREPREMTPALAAQLNGVDGVFFAADGRHAILVRPNLPQGLPCFATSQITIGRAVPPDLAGVHYLEIPWLAEPDRPQFAAYGRTRSVSGDIERLYALGVDAWQLLDRVLRGQGVVDLEGLTGRLNLLPDGSIVRELTPLVAGAPVRIQTSESLLGQRQP